MDDWLKKRLDKYDEWLDSGKIAYSSKVIPIRESLHSPQWILPTVQVLQIIKDARTIALTDCICRTHYKRCDNPTKVCLILNGRGQSIVDKGLGTAISFEEAASILTTANERGLVHLSLYQPDHELYALCSCCACCCHDLQLLLSFNQKRIIAHADFIAQNEPDACTHCGECVDRCVFGVRAMREQEMVYDPDRCYGCGLCITTCPVSAISLIKRVGKKAA
jgi:ferredoxin